MTKIILDKVFAPISYPRRNIHCITFTATAALAGAMLASGIPVKRHVLAPDQFVAPKRAFTKEQLWELLNDPRFVFLGVVTFLVSPTGSNQTFNVPGNWNSTINGPGGFANKAETIAGGGSGGAAFGTAGFISADASGGGGGGYSVVTNLVFVPGSTATYQIGIGGAAVAQSSVNAGTNGNNGGDSWFNGSTLGGSSVGAKAGLGGLGSGSGGALSGGAGGAASGGVGSTRRNGGAGGATGNTSGGGIVSSGGGGAGGPSGDGSAAGSATNNNTSNGGNADNNTVPGGSGGNPNGNAGGNGTEFDPSHGCGGGGGGAISLTANTIGGSGGSYGGGGGAASSDTGSTSVATSGAGSQGIIVVTNIPATRGLFAGIVE